MDTFDSGPDNRFRAGSKPNRFAKPLLEEWDAGTEDWNIPPRGWLLGNVFCRGFVSSLVAEGGTGKTAVRIAQLLSLACHRELTGEHIFQRCRVLIVCFEDGRDELRRRVRAAMLHYKVDNDAVLDHLFLAVPGPTTGKFFVQDERLRPVPGGLEISLTETIKRRRIDLVCVDPFVKTHRLPENDNSAMDSIIELLANLATQLDIAVDIPHHVSKGIADPGNANRGRGASAVKDGGRLVYTLSTMSSDEASVFNIADGERRFYARMDSAKVNIAPPMLTAKWFQLVGVPIDNPTELYPAGDYVQVATPWTPPGLFDDLSNDTLNKALTIIDQGLLDEDGRPTGSLYTAKAQSRTRWAGHVLVETLGCDEDRAKRIIKIWMEAKPGDATGLLVEVDFHDGKQIRKGLRVDESKRPGSVVA